jgi:hypothetical protein
MTGNRARASARPGLRGTSPSASSGRGQKPAAHSDVTERARPRRASSSAIHAPSELPARCAAARPRASRKSPSTRASATGPGDAPSSSGGESPKPGRSTVMTTNSLASGATTGSQIRRVPPMP